MIRVDNIRAQRKSRTAGMCALHNSFTNNITSRWNRTYNGSEPNIFDLLSGPQPAPGFPQPTWCVWSRCPQTWKRSADSCVSTLPHMEAQTLERGGFGTDIPTRGEDDKRFGFVVESGTEGRPPEVSCLDSILVVPRRI